MVLDSLPAPEHLRALGPGVALGLDFLERFDPSTPDGRYPVAGEEVFALVSSYDTGPATGRRFETHRRHLDVQLVAEGQERILHAPAATLTPATEYDEGADVLFYVDPPFSSSLLLRPGELALFYPGDAHKPGCMAGGRHRVKKVVVKIRLTPSGSR